MPRDRWQYRVTLSTTKFDVGALNGHVKKMSDGGWELTAATVASFQESAPRGFTVELVHTLYWRKPQGVGYALRRRLPWGSR